jgi:hypothetical protein
MDKDQVASNSNCNNYHIYQFPNTENLWYYS